MRVRFFGRLRDAIGEAIDVDLPPRVRDTEALRAWLGGDHPVLLDQAVKVAVDDRIAAAPAPLAGASEVAFLPPVSGG